MANIIKHQITSRLAGMQAEQLIFDIGFGFGKEPGQNMQALAAAPALRILGQGRHPPLWVVRALQPPNIVNHIRTGRQGRPGHCRFGEEWQLPVSGQNRQMTLSTNTQIMGMPTSAPPSAPAGPKSPAGARPPPPL